jgi:hypothetical protein
MVCGDVIVVNRVPRGGGGGGGVMVWCVVMSAL